MRRVRRTSQKPNAGLAWTARDIALLAELYPTCNNRDLADRLGRSEWAVVGKARGLGLTKDYRRGYRRRSGEPCPWSSEETDLLHMLYPTTPNEEIAERMGRSRDAVHMKARRLQLRKMEFWSEREDQFLRDTYRMYPCEEVACRLGRSLGAVKARALTLKLEPKVPQWSDHEVRFLREAYGTRDLSAMAAELGRTRAAVAKKAREMGLVRFRHWSSRDVRKLRQLYPRCTVRDLADKLGRSFESVRYKALQLGLRKQVPPAEPVEVLSLCDRAVGPGCDLSLLSYCS